MCIRDSVEPRQTPRHFRQYPQSEKGGAQGGQPGDETEEMNGTLAEIYRHPIKGHGREALASVRLLVGECLPWDRHWAVAHEAARLEPGWNRCVNFARGAKAPELMAITSTLDEATRTVTLHHPRRGDITFCPDDALDVARFLDLSLIHI